MGLIVPRFQETAVARNRLRRRLREVWRREILSVQPAWDLVVRARRESYAAPYATLRAELLAWRDAAIGGTTGPEGQASVSVPPPVPPPAQ